MKTINFYQLAKEGVQNLQAYEPGKPIAEVEREYGVFNAIKLASNENPRGPSPSVVAAIQAALPHLSRYPDGNGYELKRVLADKHQVGMQQITLGNGSSEVLAFIARVFVGAQDAIMYSRYSFASYSLIAQICNAKSIVVPDQGWTHNLNAILTAITPKTRVIYVDNPNNPTGTWLSSKALWQFLNAVPQDVIVVIDEAYIEYVGDIDTPDCSRWLDDFPNLVIARTFSKVYGLASLRVGYALSNPAIADLLNRVREPFNVNSLALAAAHAALKDVVHLEESVEMNRQGMQFLCAKLDELNLAYIPSATNFLTFDLEQPSLPIYEALMRKGVITRPLSSYDMTNYMRVSVGLPEENQQFIKALTEVLSAQRRVEVSTV